jgi:hypothetical protein
LTNSATITFEKEDQVQAIKEAVDATGKQGKIIRVTPPGVSLEKHERVVDLRVEGMLGELDSQQSSNCSKRRLIRLLSLLQILSPQGVNSLGGIWPGIEGG